MYDVGIPALLSEKKGGFQFCAPKRFRYHGAGQNMALVELLAVSRHEDHPERRELLAGLLGKLYS
jgi:hypothetical protein